MTLVAGGARTVRLTGAGGKLRIDVVAGSAGASGALAKTVAHMFRLDEDLSAFYAAVCDDGVRGRREDDVNVHTNLPLEVF